MHNIIRSSFIPNIYYKEREDIHKEYYDLHHEKLIKINNSCTNIIYFIDMDIKTINKFTNLIINLYKCDDFDISDNKFTFYTLCTPIDRAHLFTLSLFCDKIDYYYYELNLNIFGYESYQNGELLIKKINDSQKFLYDYGKALGLLEEITDQIQIVKDLMIINNIDDIDDIDDLGDLQDVDGFELTDFIYDETWFFDSDGLKEHMKGQNN
jgi:hypothetical protein